MFGFLDIRIGQLTLFKMRSGYIVIRGDGDETRDPSSKEGFCIQPREWRNWSVPRKKIGGTLSFALFSLLLRLITR
jgi:hypothetical protein